MNRLIKKLWNDQGGFILSSEAMILWTITVLGLITGLVAVRDATVTELVEVANAILCFDQSFAYDGLYLTNLSGSGDETGHTNGTGGSNGQDYAGTNASNTLAWYGVGYTVETVTFATAVNTIAVNAP